MTGLFTCYLAMMLGTAAVLEVAIKPDFRYPRLSLTQQAAILTAVCVFWPVVWAVALWEYRR